MIAIGCDHAGCEMKKAIIDALSEKGFDWRTLRLSCYRRSSLRRGNFGEL